MSAILGTAAVLIRGDTQGLGGDLSKAKGLFASALMSLSNPVTAALGGIAAIAGGLLGIGAVASSVFSTIGEGIEGFNEATLLNAKLEGVLKATGGAAGYTGDQLRMMADNLQKTTIHEGDAILGLQAKLLTFKTVQGDVFSRALELSLDLADAGFGSAEGAVVQLGKALENPTKGMTALARSGVTFTDAEKKKIKALQESGRLLEAQEIILAAVKGQVGGVAKELGKTDAGRAKILENLIGDAKERLGSVFAPLMNKFMEVKLAVINTMATIAEKIKPWLDVAVGYVTEFVQDVAEWVQAGVEHFSLLWATAPKIMKAIVMTILDYWMFWREALPQYIAYGIRAAFDLWLKWLDTLYTAVWETIKAIGSAFLELPGIIADALTGGGGVSAIGEGLKAAFDHAIAPLRGTIKGLAGELPDWDKAMKPSTRAAWAEIADDLAVIGERKKELEAGRGGAGPLGEVGKARPKGGGIGAEVAEAFEKKVDWGKLAGFQSIEGLSRSIQEQMLKDTAAATTERGVKASEGSLVKLASIDKHMTTLAMEAKKEKKGAAVLGDDGGGVL